MKWTNLFENADQLRLIQGIEAKLLSRKRTETISFFVGIAAFLLQALFELISEKNYSNLNTWKTFLIFYGTYRLIGKRQKPMSPLLN